MQQAHMQANTQTCGETREERIARIEAEQRAIISASIRKKVHIPALYDGASLDECRSEVRDYAESLMHGSSDWLLIDGKNGRGKTYHACAVLNRIWRYRDSRFTTIQEILDKLRATFSGSGDYAYEMSFYTDIDVLVIDDLGKEQATEWTLPIMFELLRKREADMRPTIITTNLDAQGLYDHLLRQSDKTLAESIISRMGAAIRVTITGEDRRFSHVHSC